MDCSRGGRDPCDCCDLIQQKWLPDYNLAAFLIAMVILGIAFYWVYTIDKERLWWALISTLAMVTLLATGIVAYFTPKDASGSSPYGVITLGLGAVIIGYVLKRPNAKFVLNVIAIITLLVGILMLPFGGRDPGVRSAMGLSTANRNGAAALLVATQNFSGTNTLPFVLVGVILLLLILLPIAKRMGARSEAASSK